MPLAQPGLQRKQQNGALPPGRPQWPSEKPKAGLLLLGPLWGRPLAVPGLPCISQHSQGWLMGKAELTAPRGGRALEEGEGEAGGSCGSGGEAQRFAVGEVKVISVQGSGRGWGSASKLGLTEAQLFLGLLRRLLCPSAGRPAAGPGLSGGECTDVGAGRRAHRPAGAGIEGPLPGGNKNITPFMRRGPSRPVSILYLYPLPRNWSP